MTGFPPGATRRTLGLIASSLCGRGRPCTDDPDSVTPLRVDDDEQVARSGVAHGDESFLSDRVQRVRDRPGERVAKVVDASSNDTPCLPRFAEAFSRSTRTSCADHAPIAAASRMLSCLRAAATRLPPRGVLSVPVRVAFSPSPAGS